MNEILFNLIIAFISVVIIPVFGFLGNALIKLIQEKIKSEKLKSGLSIVLDIIQKSASHAAQIYKDELHGISEPTFDDQKNAMKKAITKVKGFVSEDIKKLIESYQIDFDEWLETQIKYCTALY